MISPSTRGFMVAVVLAFTHFSALAVPMVMDFEPGGDFVLNGSSYSQAGFSLAATGGDALVDLSFCDPLFDACAIGNSTSYAQALNDTRLTLTRDGGGAFALGSFEASFLPSPFIDYSSLSIRLLLDGTTDGGGAVNQYFDLLGDPGTANFLFSNYLGTGDLLHLTSVTFGVCFFDGNACNAASGLFTNDAQFALDNVTLADVTTVPEPTTVLLLMLGLVGLLLARRRLTVDFPKANKQISGGGESMKKASMVWVTALLFAVGSAGAQSDELKSYIVQLVDQPVAANTGKVQGYAATKPTPGQKLDMRASTVQAYVSYLSSRQAAVLSALPNVHPTQTYSVAFNGFSAMLSDSEVAQLKHNASVVAVTPDLPRTPDTSTTPTFLGLTAPGGLYSQNVLGEDIIIGMVDTGATPESPSFSDKVDASGKPVPSQQPGTVVYNPLPAGSWNGSCDAGPGFAATDCNNKLIGARYFHAGFDASGLTKASSEFLSPRDGDGHGTHTGSTAGGNSGVTASINGVPVGVISGIAPRARIAAYKVCWTYIQAGVAKNTCFSSDLVAAIDQAVADGVDVINYSISGTQTDYLDPEEIAFLHASDAGVFVAASAGNAGPANTVAHMSPWLTTVAASTHDRSLIAAATLGDGSAYTGASLQTSGVPSKPLIASSAAGLAGAAPTKVSLCYAAVDNGGVAVLDPAKVAGKIVVCDRGTTARVNKSLAVREAGGAGMVLVNVIGGATDVIEDAHYVPTVHLTSAARAHILVYAAGGSGTAAIAPSVQATGVVAPVMAAFSSRGPSLANISILKPDITAPGVNVLAAFAPAGANATAIDGGTYPAPTYNFLQGTSMSSPHIAGMAALLKQQHPSWSPAAIKSALMTTTTSVKLASGADDPARFGYGAGHANPNGAAAVGLVYDAGTPDYLAFLCGIALYSQSSVACQTYGSILPWNLNLPSLTSEVVGRQTIQRTVTNVGTSTATYNGSAAIPGFSATVSPSTLTLAPGTQGTFTVTALRTDATLGEWRFGNLDWSDGTNTVRSPVTLKALAFSAPALIEDTRVRANKLFTVATGYDGTLKAGTVGLLPATRTAGSVPIDSVYHCNQTISVPVGSDWLRVALFNIDTAGNGLDDIDIQVRNASNVVVAGSYNEGSNELINIPAPPAGTYSVCVNGYGTSRPGVTNLAYTLSHWLVAPGSGIANSLRVSTPANVVTGGTGTVAFLWSVPAGSRYFTTVQFTDGANTLLGRTGLYIGN